MKNFYYTKNVGGLGLSLTDQFEIRLNNGSQSVVSAINSKDRKRKTSFLFNSN